MLKTPTIKFYNKWQYLLIYSFKQGNLKMRGFILSQIGFLVELCVTLFIWGLFTGQNKSTITYFFVGFIIQRLVWNAFAGDLSRDIVSGKLNSFLIRPISLFKFLLIKEIGNRFIGNILSALTVLCLFPFYKDLLTLPPNNTFWIFLPAIIIIGFLVDFCISLFISSIAFFDNDYAGFVRVIIAILTLASGIRVPFDYFPAPFDIILKLNPYAWMTYQPMQIYLGKYDLNQSVSYTILGFVWVLTMLFGLRILFKFGLKKYEGVGL